MLHPTPHGHLVDYRTGADLRAATLDEAVASIHAAELDGGVGVIVVDIDGLPTPCFVS